MRCVFGVGGGVYGGMPGVSNSARPIARVSSSQRKQRQTAHTWRRGGGGGGRGDMGQWGTRLDEYF